MTDQDLQRRLNAVVQSFSEVCNRMISACEMARLAMIDFTVEMEEHIDEATARTIRKANREDL
jgi:hypothetical protein